jgi:very-short-patch-repair endonuclease
MSELDLRIAERAARQHQVIALRQLRELGAGEKAVRRRLSDRRLHPLFRGVFAVGLARPSLRGRWKAATLALGEDALLSHRDAAVLLDLASERRPGVDVTVPGRNARSQPGISAHRIVVSVPADRNEVDGIPVTSVARTLLDLAALLGPTKLRRAYERAERVQALDVRAIDDLLLRSNGHRGAGRLRDLRAYDPALAAQAESELERIFLDLLRAHRVPMPQVNVLVDGFLVDAYWPEADVVAELDGYEFHHDREAFERDHAKLAKLRLAGHEVLALTYEQVVRDPSWAVTTVTELIKRGRLRLRTIPRSHGAESRRSL